MAHLDIKKKGAEITRSSYNARNTKKHEDDRLTTTSFPLRGPNK